MSSTDRQLVIIGASGHGRVVCDIAELSGYKKIVFLDADDSITDCYGHQVIGPDSLLPQIEGDVFVAIGDCVVRRKLMEMNDDRFFPVLMHPKSVVAKDVCLGAGTVVMAGAIINPGSFIGKGVIVNTGASIDHDCTVEDFSHISVGAHLCGTVNVGMNTWIGAGATVINDVNISSDCMVGAGGVVVESLKLPGKYLGVPAKMCG